MSIQSFMQINEHVAQFTVGEKPTELTLAVLIKTRVCCAAGDVLHIYTVKLPSCEFFLKNKVELSGLYEGFFLKPFTNNKYYGIPHNSRQIHILEVLPQQVRSYLVYTVKPPSREFSLKKKVDLPGLYTGFILNLFTNNKLLWYPP